MPHNAFASPDNAIAIGHNPLAMPDIASVLPDIGLVSLIVPSPTAALIKQRTPLEMTALRSPPASSHHHPAIAPSQSHPNRASWQDE